jgi:hypothetical protein
VKQPGADDPTRVSPSGSGCTLCGRLREAGEDDRTAFGPRGRPDAIAEAIADAFGYCAEHGPLLADTDLPARTMAGILHDAIDRIIVLLGDPHRNAGRLDDLCFAAGTACPICRSRDHRAAQAARAIRSVVVSQPPSLCFPHFRQVASLVDSDVLTALARLQLDAMRAAAQEAEAIATRTDAIACSDRAIAERLRAVLEIVAGARRDLRDHRHAGHGGAPSPLDGGSSDPETPGCPVCEAIAGAHAAWREEVRIAAHLAQDVWIVFPTCAEHIRECAPLDEPQLASRVVRYGAGVERDLLERGIALISADNERRRTAMASVGYRPQSPAYVLGRQRRMVTGVPRCPGCERAAVAREASVARLVERLRKAFDRDVEGRVRALCLKHFAAIHLLLPLGAARQRLVAVELERLGAIRRRLADDLVRADAPPYGAPSASVRDALRSLSAWA